MCKSPKLTSNFIRSFRQECMGSISLTTLDGAPSILGGVLKRPYPPLGGKVDDVLRLLWRSNTLPTRSSGRPSSRM